MKRILISLGVISVSLVFMMSMLKGFTQDTSLSDWGNNFPGYIEASQLQSVSAKPIALFFHTDWCSSCKTLREQVLSSSEVKAFMQNLHPVQINPEISAYEETLAQEFGVMAYPSFFLVMENGDVVKQISRTTNISPAQFVTQLQEALAGS